MMAPAYKSSSTLRSALGPDAAHFIDAGTLSFSLLPYIEAADAMLVLDAADHQRARRAPSPSSRGRLWTHFGRPLAGAPFTRWASSIFWIWRGFAIACRRAAPSCVYSPAASTGANSYRRGLRQRFPEAAYARRRRSLQRWQSPLSRLAEIPIRIEARRHPPAGPAPCGGLGGQRRRRPPHGTCESARPPRQDPGARSDRFAQPADEPRGSCPSSSAYSAKAKCAQRSRPKDVPTVLCETRMSGVWWVEHRDAQGKLMAELLEVAQVPAILASASDEIARRHGRCVST